MKKALYILLVGIIAIGSMVGCQKKRGCTDSYSDNYDPEAKEDDDTCIPTRLKFVGNYLANGTIETGEDTLIPYDQVFIIVDDSATTGLDGLSVNISNFDREGAIVPLRAVITGEHEFKIDRQDLNFGPLLSDSLTYWGEGKVSEKVIEIDMTRVEKIEVWIDTVMIYDYDTLYLHLYGIKEVE